jgi:hypothetical protein
MTADHGGAVLTAPGKLVLVPALPVPLRAPSTAASLAVPPSRRSSARTRRRLNFAARARGPYRIAGWPHPMTKRRRPALVLTQNLFAYRAHDEHTAEIVIEPPEPVAAEWSTSVVTNTAVATDTAVETSTAVVTNTAVGTSDQPGADVNPEFLSAEFLSAELEAEDDDLSIFSFGNHVVDVAVPRRWRRFRRQEAEN